MKQEIRRQRNSEELKVLIPSRSLIDVASGPDYFAALAVIRARFIPNFDPHEFNGKIINTIEWLKNTANYSKFDQANKHPQDLQFLPDYVRGSRLAVNLYFELGHEVNLAKEDIVYSRSVAFPPKSKEFREDLHRVVFHLFEKLRTYDPIKGDVKLEMKYNIDNLALISAFYKSGGHDHKNEATDAISTILFGRYWESLKESAKILAAPEKRMIH